MFLNQQLHIFNSKYRYLLTIIYEKPKETVELTLKEINVPH